MNEYQFKVAVGLLERWANPLESLVDETLVEETNKFLAKIRAERDRYANASVDKMELLKKLGIVG